MQKQYNPTQKKGHKIKAEWLALLVGSLLCTFAVLLWWMLDQREQTSLHNEIRSEAEDMASSIDADMHSRIPALQRMARRWENRGSMPKKEFISDTQAYVSDMPGYQALGWVDKDLFIRWIVPIKGNEQAQNLNLAFEQKRRIALEKAKESKSPTMTAPIDLVQGGKGFQIYFPIYLSGEFEGFILAVFRVQEWLDYIFNFKEHDVSENFRISAILDDIPVFKQTGWDHAISGLDSLTETKILDHRLSIHVRPTQTYIEQNKTLLPEITAVSAVLLSVLMAFIVYLFQKVSMEARAINAAKTALELEIREHAETENELQHALSRLDIATKAGGIGVWEWELSTDILTWNERMYFLYDTPADVKPTYDTWRNALHPDDRPAAESLLNNAVQGRAVFNTEFRIIHRNGDVRHIGAAAEVKRDNTGKPGHVTGINWDITDLKKAEETRKKSEEQVRHLLNSTAEAIYGIDLNGNCIFANPSCLRILGYTDVEYLLGKNMHQLIHYSYPDGRPMPVEVCRIYRAFREGKGVHVDDEVLWRADGTSFPAEYWSYPQIVNGKVSGAVVTFIDITERRKAEELLAEERRRLSYILEGTNAGTWEWNVQTGKTIYNERWAEIIGYTLEELAPVSIDTWKKFAHPDDLKTSEDLLGKHFKKELAYYECEVRMRHKNGNWVWTLDRGKVATWTDDGKPLVMSGTHQEITQRKLAEEQIQHMATHDGLTDLPTLRLANDRLSLSLSIARRNKTMVAVMFIDLDSFKMINDTLGHAAGDSALKQVARRLFSCVRETDTVARVGGDEFLFIAAGLQNAENAALIAEKIIQVVSQPLILNGQQAAVGTSIGIALFPRDGDDVDRLIKLADEAMYEVKNTGKNGYSFFNTAKGAK